MNHTEQLAQALEELIECKSLKDRQAACWPNDPEAPELAREYSRRKPLAWAAAAAALAAYRQEQAAGAQGVNLADLECPPDPEWVDKQLADDAFDAWWKAHAFGPRESSRNAWRACWRYWLQYMAQATPEPAAQGEAVSIIHAEADRTLSREDFEMCRRMVKRALATHPVAAPSATEEAVSSIDHAQRQGYLGSPEEWRERCRLYRTRCDTQDCANMAKLHAYVEDGLLIVTRPDAPTSAPLVPSGLWTIIGPEGTSFTGETPFRAANAAQKARVLVNSIEAKEFKDTLDDIQRENEAENARLLAEYGTLDCPTCGGSGHIGDVAPPTAPTNLHRICLAARELCRQITINDFTDNRGHKAQGLQAYRDTLKLLGEIQMPMAAEQQEKPNAQQ